MSESAIGPGRMKEIDKVKGKDCDTPNSPGIYRLIDKESGDIDYVGKTNQLRTRLQQHERYGLFDAENQKIAYSKAKSSATPEAICEKEKEHIKRHSPSCNITKGGNGRK